MKFCEYLQNTIHVMDYSWQSQQHKKNKTIIMYTYYLLGKVFVSVCARKEYVI